MYLRRATNHVNGVATGGTSESGFDLQPQPSLFTVKLHNETTVREFVLPKGTVLLETWIIPDADATATAGTVTLTDTTNAITYLNAAPVSTVSRATLATPGVVPSDARFRVTPTGLATGTGCSVGFLLVLPKIRS